MPNSFRFGSTGGGSTRLGGGGNSFRWGGSAIPTVTAKKHDWRDELLGGISFGPGLIQRYGGPFSFIGSAGAALGTSPLQVLLYPKGTAKNLIAGPTGIWEGGYSIGKSLRQVGGKDTASMFLDSMVNDYKDRYGKDWKDHAHDNPLFNLFDALTVVGTAARGATLLDAYGRLGAAGKEITLPNLWKESSAPGRISEGEAFTRNVSYQPSVGDREFAVQPWSRSPVRRGFQGAGDVLAERFPNTPLFGAAHRTSRAQAMQLGRVMDRTLGDLHGVEALDSKKLGDAGRSRLFWEGQLGIADEGLSLEERNAKLTKLRDALAKEFDAPAHDQNPEFAQIMREAKQAGFGKGVLLKRLEAGIEFDPAKAKGHYEIATDALRQMTVLSERTIMDSEGFGSLQQDLKRVSDQIAGLKPQSKEWLKAVEERTRLRLELSQKAGDLETMFRNRRGLVRDWLDTQGDHAHSRAWHEALTNLIGEKKANDSVAFAHAVANKIRPDDPESWWRDRVGMPSGESAALFRQRVGEDALFQPGMRRIFEEQVEGLPGSETFYSPLQKALESDAWPDAATAGKYKSLAKASTTGDELENTGLMDWLEAMPGEQSVTKGDIQNFLSSYMNDYNLEEYHFVNGAEGYDTRWNQEGTLYGGGANGTLISRDPAKGEYHEIVMRLPGSPRPGLGRPPGLEGAGSTHWDMEGVIFHVRFHIFEEGGVRKLLVDEIQSDWMNDLRRAKQEGREFKIPNQDELGEASALVAKQDKLVQERISPLEDEMQRIEGVLDEFMSPEGEIDPEGLARFSESVKGGVTEAEANQMKDRWDELDNELSKASNEFYDLNKEVQDLLGSDTGPSPLGERYYKAAIRRVVREAVDENVDEIILSDGDTHYYRNEGDFFSSSLTPEEQRAFHGEKMAADRAAMEDIGPPPKPSFFKRLYEEVFPNALAKEYGVKGEHRMDAYQGRFSMEMAGKGKTGDMSGTVFKVTQGMREKAARSQRLYQKAVDPNALPKGAVEMLGNGKSQMHLFQDGDVSTWIHELGHVALHDLSEEDQGILSGHYAQGKPIEEWSRTAHENYARDFEGYVRNGVAPSRALEPIFARLSAWIKQIWEREKIVNPNLDPRVQQIFASLFHAESEPDIFIPHRAGVPDLGGGRTSRSIPRAQREIGDRTVSRIPIFAKNKLGLMRSGMLYDDPRTLVEHTNRVVALAKANQLREAVLHMGEPLLPGDPVDFDTQYVVKKAGRGVDKPLHDALESTDDPVEVQQTIKNYVDSYITDDETKYEQWKGEGQLYKVDKRQVDMLFKYVTGKAPGAATKPMTNSAKVFDAVLDSVRALLLYANPGFYTTNILGNTTMMMLKDPASIRYLPQAMQDAVRAASSPAKVDPRFHRITVEMGRGPMTATFSQGAMRDILSTQPGSHANLPGRAAERWSHHLGAYGRRSGRVIDDAFRVSAWRQSAAKLGYRTDAQVDALFEDASIRHPFKGKALQQETKAEKDLAKIRDEAEQLMFDFDSMSPWERTYLQRMIFLYPFVKASAKYPFMFAGERPITAGLLTAASAQGQKFANEVLGPRPDLPIWLQGYARGPGGYYNVASISPFSQPAGLLQSLMAILGPAPVGVQRPGDYMNPTYQMILDAIRQQNAYGRDASVPSIIRDEFPLPAYLRYPIRKPSQQYQERDFLNTLLRSLRIAPTQLTAGMGTPPSG